MYNAWLCLADGDNIILNLGKPLCYFTDTQIPFYQNNIPVRKKMHQPRGLTAGTQFLSHNRKLSLFREDSQTLAKKKN